MVKKSKNKLLSEKSDDPSITFGERFKSVLDNLIDQLPEESAVEIPANFAESQRVAVQGVLEDDGTGANMEPKDDGDEDFFEMFAPPVQGRANLRMGPTRGANEPRISLNDLIKKEQEISRNSICDLHPITSSVPKNRLDAFIEKEIREFLVKGLRSRDESKKFMIIVTGRGLRGETKGYVERLLNDLRYEGLVLQYVLDYSGGAFIIEVQ